MICPGAFPEPLSNTERVVLLCILFPAMCFYLWVIVHSVRGIRELNADIRRLTAKLRHPTK